MYKIVNQIPESNSQFARVEIEPMRVHVGNEVVEVTAFWMNGRPWYTTEGYKIKKDGTRHARYTASLPVPVPQEIKDLLDELAWQ